MRTTVTLDADVAVRLREVAQTKGMSFKEALNNAIREGLAGDREGKSYVTPSRPMGLRPGIDLDKALQLAGQLEDAEVVRKLELRK